MSGPPRRIEDCDSWRHAITQTLSGRTDSARSTRERASQRLVAAMKDFEKQWPAIVADIPSDPTGRGEYLALRDRLETDDLPRWEAQFRDQLERNAIHELVAFSAYLEWEAASITSRINTINGALGRIDYRPGTYIRLEVERSADPVVREFRAQLRDITSNATFGGDDDTYAEARFLKVKDLLDRFRGREGYAAADQNWTARVTDVRTWFSFAASERDRAEDTELEHYSDSGGKSGGQKEKLAYTILAASLSYTVRPGRGSAGRVSIPDDRRGVRPRLRRVHPVRARAVHRPRPPDPRRHTASEDRDDRAVRRGGRVGHQRRAALPAAPHDRPRGAAAAGSAPRGRPRPRRLPGNRGGYAGRAGRFAGRGRRMTMARPASPRSTRVGGPGSWDSQATVRDAARIKWDRGAVLREWTLPAEQRTVFPLRVRLAGPTRDDLAERFGDVVAWARALRDDAHRHGWELLTRTVRVGTGRQQIPVAGRIPTPQVAAGLLDPACVRAAAAFNDALTAAAALDAAAADVALARPHDVLAAASDWPLLLELARWLREHPRPGVYPRQIPVAGLHTKLVETHRALLTRLLDAVLPADTVTATASSFAGRYGLREPARRIRVRGAAAVLGLPPGPAAVPYGDVVWDIAVLAALDQAAVGVTELLVVENKTSFLTVPHRPDRLVVWGEGYGADELLRALPWVPAVAVRYWGDIDTHGFTILDRVRAVAPHTVSVLMDTRTLLAHRAFWVTEPVPRLDPLTHLTVGEADVYDALRAGTYGDRVRLEQELVRFDHVEAALR
ncbi:MAG: Wadjet anti-phage system protein JetD domain-containing protein [Mycobacterium leprae]